MSKTRVQKDAQVAGAAPLKGKGKSVRPLQPDHSVEDLRSEPASDLWIEFYQLATKLSLAGKMKEPSAVSLTLAASMRNVLPVIERLVDEGEPTALELIVTFGNAFARMIEAAAEKHPGELRGICKDLPSIAILASPKAFRRESSRPRQNEAERARLNRFLQMLCVGTNSAQGVWLEAHRTGGV